MASQLHDTPQSGKKRNANGDVVVKHVDATDFYVEWDKISKHRVAVVVSSVGVDQPANTVFFVYTPQPPMVVSTASVTLGSVRHTLSNKLEQIGDDAREVSGRRLWPLVNEYKRDLVALHGLYYEGKGELNPGVEMRVFVEELNWH